jgi:dihydrofolate reductase
MGMIHIDLFTTLDGVAQAPGGPEEDTDGGFPFAGWQAPLFDDAVGEQVGSGLAELDALLLGRRTYEIFAAYWPHQEAGVDGGIAELFNRVPKYVASRGTPSLDWAGSTQLGPDLGSAVRDVRERHEHVHVIGSVNLVQTLLAQDLYDELTLWVHPVVLGTGKKVFPDGATAARLRLTAPAITSPSGTVLLRYAPTGAVPTTGDMSQDRGSDPA